MYMYMYTVHHVHMDVCIHNCVYTVVIRMPHCTLCFVGIFCGTQVHLSIEMLVKSAFSVLCYSLVLSFEASHFTPIVFSPESSQSWDAGLVENAELIDALTKTAQYIHTAQPWHLSSGYCMDIVNRIPSSYSGYAVSPVIYSSDTSQCGEDILEDS